MTKNTTTADWEKRLSKLMTFSTPLGEIVTATYTKNVSEREIKDFISNLLASQKAEIIKKIEEGLRLLNDEYQSELHGGYDDADRLNNLQTALWDMEQLIQTIKEDK